MILRLRTQAFTENVGRRVSIAYYAFLSFALDGLSFACRLHGIGQHGAAISIGRATIDSENLRDPDRDVTSCA